MSICFLKKVDVSFKGSVGLILHLCIKMPELALNNLGLLLIAGCTRHMHLRTGTYNSYTSTQNRVSQFLDNKNVSPIKSDYYKFTRNEAKMIFFLAEQMYTTKARFSSGSVTQYLRFRNQAIDFSKLLEFNFCLKGYRNIFPHTSDKAPGLLWCMIYLVWPLFLAFASIYPILGTCVTSIILCIAYGVPRCGEAFPTNRVHKFLMVPNHIKRKKKPTKNRGPNALIFEKISFNSPCLLNWHIPRSSLESNILLARIVAPKNELYKFPLARLCENQSLAVYLIYIVLQLEKMKNLKTGISGSNLVIGRACNKDICFLHQFSMHVWARILGGEIFSKKSLVFLLPSPRFNEIHSPNIKFINLLVEKIFDLFGMKNSRHHSFKSGAVTSIGNALRAQNLHTTILLETMTHYSIGHKKMEALGIASAMQGYKRITLDDVAQQFFVATKIALDNKNRLLQNKRPILIV